LLLVVELGLAGFVIFRLRLLLLNLFGAFDGLAPFVDLLGPGTMIRPSANAVCSL
jgi:hypothetical protein